MRRFLPLLAIPLAALAPTPARAQDDSASIIAHVESPPKPDHQGLDSFTLAELMRRFHVPGVSIALVRDFKLDWAKASGVICCRNPFRRGRSTFLLNPRG